MEEETRLDSSQWAATREALLGERSDALIDLVFRLQVGIPLGATEDGTWELAEALGWAGPGRRSLSRLGYLVADPIREYRFWIERDRTIHSERVHPALAPREYAGKSVLEPGSGFGCNLFSLSAVPGRFVGLEPVA
ncbi:MAG: hypothetical protein H5U40_01705, partial [Polyangiaceae bacterium]|nr:hypothetical protein [Polyangiaceae bacterium]